MTVHAARPPRRWPSAVRARSLRAVEWVGSAMRSVPGVGGAAAIAYGVGMVYLPAGIICAGLFLLALDRRL